MEKSNVKHYVVTRFNVPNKTGINLKPDWVKDRVRLLTNYSLPSVVSQTRDSFVWLLFMDNETPASWVNRLADIVRGSLGGREFKICLISDKFSSEILSSAIIGLSMDENPSHIITTLLDVDDAISPEYIESVESLFIVSGTGTRFIAAQNGICFSEESSQYLSNSGVFPAVVSCHEEYLTSQDCYTQQLTTCYHPKNLSALRSLGRLLKPKFGACWLKVFHKNNSLSRIFPDGIQVDSKIIQDRFSNILDFK